MRLSRWTAVAAVPLAVPLLSARAPAQQPFRVVRHAPVDTARSGDVISVTFDRPVAGSLERSPNPNDIVRIRPALPADIQWRDPVTLRVIPRDPLEPGRRYQITVNSSFSAIDGGRLAAPYTFTIVTRGPALLASIPPLSSSEIQPTRLDPSGKIRLVYSAAVDLATLGRTVRLELAATGGKCELQSLHYMPRVQRAVTDSDDYAIRAAGGDDASGAARFRRVIELVPARRPPDDCHGTLVLPSFDPHDRGELRYPSITAPTFQVGGPHCTVDDCAAGAGLRLWFTTPVQRRELLGRVHLEPPVPFTLDETDVPTPYWLLRFAVAPRTTYRLTIDSAVTDVFGRSLRATAVRTLAVGDRPARIGHELGLVTIPRVRPALRLTHLNVDRVELVIVPIPDSLRIAVMRVIVDPDSVARMISRLRDTIRQVVDVHAPLNEVGITEVPIPPGVMARFPGSLLAVRARIPASQPMTSAPVHDGSGLLPGITIVARSEEPSPRVAVVQLTDLLAHAKVADGWGSVFVTDMNDGRPVAGAHVSVRDARDRAIATATTNASGVAELEPAPAWRPAARASAPDVSYHYTPWWSGDARIVEVTRGRDRSLTSVQSQRNITAPLDAYRGAGWYDRAQITKATVYTERDIYRPGERIYLGGIVRYGWLGNLRTPSAGDSVRVKVSMSASAQGDAVAVRDTVLRLDAFGTVADSFVVPRLAPLGYYRTRLEVMTISGWQLAAQGYVRVAEYRAPEFRTTLALDTATTLFLGDTVRGGVGASYYFDAPMAGAVVRWSERIAPLDERLRVPGLPSSYVIGDQYFAREPRDTPPDQTSGQDTLDAQGSFTLAIPTRAGALTAPGELSIDVAVEDVNRRVVGDQRALVIHPASFYVAARDSGNRWYWKQRERVPVQVVAVRPDGKHVRGVRVRIDIVRHHFAYVVQGDGSAPVMRWAADTVARDSLVTADSAVVHPIALAQAGMHEVVLTAEDERGRRVTTTFGRYVLSPHYAGWWNSDPGYLPVRVARDTLSVGDTAEVTFLSPFRESEAWITVEREGVIAQRRMTVGTGETTVRVPVTDAYLPGVSISVLLTRMGAAWAMDSAHQRFRRGAIGLTVDTKSKALAVSVHPARAEYRPGDSAQVTVKVRDHRGRPARSRVTLWAVDEGVLALTGYQRPSPLDAVYASSGSALAFASTAATVAARRQILTPPGWVLPRGLYGSFAMNSLITTGTAAATTDDENAVRTDFRTTSFFRAGLTTDSAGEVSSRVRLPDNLTTYRLMAVAVTADDRYGSGESTLVATKPLMVRASLPRFVRTGDSLYAGAVIDSRTGHAVATHVRASGNGMTLLGSADAAPTVRAGTGSEVRFAWRAEGNPGDTATFRFSVSGGGHGDAVEASLPVRPFYSPRYHAVAGIARGGETVRMYLPRGIDPVRSRLTLRVGTTPAPAIRSAYAYMESYWYYCSEQLASLGQVTVAMLRLQGAGVIDSTVAPDARTLRVKLQFVADELSRRQRADGGIGYWSRHSWTDTWLTTYAGLLLADAQSMGADVSPRVIEGVAEFVHARRDTLPWLRDTVYGTRTDRARRVAWRLSSELAQLHFLRRIGKADSPREHRLLAAQGAMLWEDRVWLAELLGMGDDREAARAQLARVWHDVEMAGTRVDVPDSLLGTFGFPSHVRPVARLLDATMMIEPDHPRLAPLIERVVQHGRARTERMWNTQDFAAASRALARVAVWQRSTERAAATVTVRSARVRAGARVLLSATRSQGGDSIATLDGLLERDGDWMVLPLGLESDGGPVFYTLTVDEVPLEPPSKPDARGFIVERWFERYDDGRPVSEVKAGDLVRGRLRITVPSDREFVAVEDLLPAGLEAVDLTLRTSRSLGAFESARSWQAEREGDRANPDNSSMPWLFGSWNGDGWSPWEQTEMRDDRVQYFARILWKGTYTASYVARAVTAGRFVRPPAHAEEMYNPSLGGRSDGGTFVIR